MRLFAISDLHLSFSADKPMDVFPGWENYIERIYKNWQKTVGKDDTVVIAGDISWGMNLNESLADFKFLEGLNGKKIILKGNHDFWWTTVSGISKFFAENSLKTISILHNNCFSDGKYAICGTRGWVYDGNGEKDERVINRECGRLEKSLSDAENVNAQPIVFLHYPPVYGDYVSDEIISVLKKHNIKKVYYGHIHGSGAYKTQPEYDGILLKMISADRVGFTPVLIGGCGDFKP